MTREEQKQWEIECLKYTQLKTHYPEDLRERQIREWHDFRLKTYEEKNNK